MAWPGSPDWSIQDRAGGGTSSYVCEASIEVAAAEANRFKAEWDDTEKTSVSPSIELVPVANPSNLKVFVSNTSATIAVAHEKLMDDIKTVQDAIEAQDTAVAAANNDPGGDILTYATGISLTVTIETP